MSHAWPRLFAVCLAGTFLAACPGTPATPPEPCTESTFYVDADGDGFGDSSAAVQACEMPTDAVAQGGDCDDADVANFPGNPEACDGQDNDCNTLADVGAPGDEDDVDGDGVMVCANDCDDGDALNFPGNPELCDGADNDCNTLADFGAAGDEDDADADGVMACADDCDDADAANFPGNPELCDGQDNDCNTLADFGAPGDEDDVDGDGVKTCAGDCDDADLANFPTNPELCDGQDNDCNTLADFGAAGDEDDADSDGVMLCANDCDDADGANFPGNSELCDGADNDCNTLADVGAPGDEDDVDGDGVMICANDCDDTDGANFPGNPEACDGQDNDCNTLADVGAPGDEDDVDGDGVMVCANDCDDGDALNFPGNPELCDGADNDCNTLADFGAAGDEDDVDGDGVMICGGDCDDADALNFPTNPEVCDGQDNDCDLVIPPTEIDDDLDGYAECEGDLDDTDLCNHPGPGVCGDTCIDPTEECDDGIGNSDTDPDACRTTCFAPACGDGVADSELCFWTGQLVAEDPYTVGLLDGDGDEWPELYSCGTDLRISTMLPTGFAQLLGFQTGVTSCGAFDFDGDGFDDVVALTSDQIFIWSAATGALVTLFEAPLSTPPAAGALFGDFDGDGVLDFGERDSTTGVLSAWTVDATAGTVVLLDSITLPSCSYTANMATDLDGDGDDELVYTCFNGFDLHGMGLVGGSWTEQVTVPTPAMMNYTSSCAGDLDGNGAVDVVFYDRSPAAEWVIAWGSTPGLFSSTQTFDINGGVNVMSSCAVEDLDGDGALDLLVRSGYGLAVHWNTGTGPSTDFTSLDELGFAGGTGRTSVVVLPGGTVAAAWAEIGADRVRTIRFPPGGTTYPFVTANPDLGWRDSVYAGEFGGAPGADVAWVTNQGDAYSWLDSAGVPGSPVSSVAGSLYGFARPTSCDLDGDGFDDLLAAPGYGLSLSVALAVGDGTFQSPDFYLLSYNSGSVLDLACGDFSGDGAPDLALVDTRQNDLTMYEGVGDGTLTPAASVFTWAAFTQVALGFIDGDAILDIAVVRSGSGMRGVLAQLGPTFSDTGWVGNGNMSTGASNLSIGDIDGDGNADLVYRGASRVRWVPGDGLGGFGAEQLLSDVIEQLVMVDLDGDGDQEWWARTPLEDWDLLIEPGAPPTVTVVDRLVSMFRPANDMPNFVDLDGDGLIDLVSGGTIGLQRP